MSKYFPIKYLGVYYGDKQKYWCGPVTWIHKVSYIGRLYCFKSDPDRWFKKGCHYHVIKGYWNDEDFTCCGDGWHFLVSPDVIFNYLTFLKL